MPVGRQCRFLWCAFAALLATLLPNVTATATPRLLDCSLNEIDTTAGQNFNVETENRSISVAADDEARTITVFQDGKAWPLSHVTITQIVMNGYTDDISVGVQISSGSIVLQSYALNFTKAEFGICRQSEKQAP